MGPTNCVETFSALAISWTVAASPVSSFRHHDQAYPSARRISKVFVCTKGHGAPQRSVGSCSQILGTGSVRSAPTEGLVDDPLGTAHRFARNGWKVPRLTHAPEETILDFAIAKLGKQLVVDAILEAPTASLRPA